jgi:hypothetical protein
MKAGIIALFIQLSILGVCLVGEIKCIIKAVDCNWEPIGKAEIIYTASAFTGFGVIVGYMDIQDK